MNPEPSKASYGFKAECGEAQRLQYFFRGESKPHVLNKILEIAFEGKRVSPGMLCLAGTRWNGMLDFQNEEQMKRVEKYVGGFKYIAFT